jgi:hypothetical protein
MRSVTGSLIAGPVGWDLAGRGAVGGGDLAPGNS